MHDYISDELFHFVGHSNPTDHDKNLSTLLAVIRSGCVACKPPDSDDIVIGWGVTEVKHDRDKKLENEELVVSGITCYCDIPFELLNRHTAKYGCFGLSFKRSLLIRFGARPVTYVPMRSDDCPSPYGRTMLRDVEATFEGFMRHVYDPLGDDLPIGSRRVGAIPTNATESIRALYSLVIRDMLAFIKPYDAELPADDFNYFYSEREWRRLGGLKFSTDEICTVIVKDGYEDKFREEMPDFPGEVKVVK